MVQLNTWLACSRGCGQRNTSCISFYQCSLLYLLPFLTWKELFGDTKMSLKEQHILREKNMTFGSEIVILLALITKRCRRKEGLCRASRWWWWWWWGLLLKSRGISLLPATFKIRDLSSSKCIRSCLICHHPQLIIGLPCNSKEIFCIHAISLQYKRKRIIPPHPTPHPTNWNWMQLNSKINNALYWRKNS